MSDRMIVDVFTVDFEDDLESVILHLMPQAVNRGLKSACKEIKENAKFICPVDTGLLRSSIRDKVNEDIQEGEVSANTDYAVYVHEGTSRMPARRFLSNGAREVDVRAHILGGIKK